MTFKNLFKLIVSIGALIYFLYYASTSTDWHFIDNVNLLFHEAGHWIFSFFGDFMYVLGGSLNQVLIPIICSANFVYHNQKFSASLCLFWVGQNLINVSVYAGDAVRMRLPLLGDDGSGDHAGHDWNWLLPHTGMLHHTDLIAKIIFTSGVLVILAIIYSFKEDEKQVDLD